MKLLVSSAQRCYGKPGEQMKSLGGGKEANREQILGKYLDLGARRKRRQKESG